MDVMHVKDHTNWSQIADLYFVHQRGSANGLYMVMVMIGVSRNPWRQRNCYLCSAELSEPRDCRLYGREWKLAALLLGHHGG